MVWIVVYLSFDERIATNGLVLYARGGENRARYFRGTEDPC